MHFETLLEALNKNRRSVTPIIKDYLVKTEEDLHKRHLVGARGAEVCEAYTHLIDCLLKALFTVESRVNGCSESTALVAIGGYGRGELNIRSDIDLMLLYKKKLTPEIENLTQKILYVLWDTGLDLGFSIRSVEECISLAKDDLKTMTALLDLRMLLGDMKLFELLKSSVKKKLFTGRRASDFIRDKIEENRIRHGKYGDSVYILEPNVKEGEGGLRDIHTAMWIIKAGHDKPVEPFSLGLISEEGKASIEKSFDFLLWIRNDLHFMTRRKTDQLTFDHQERIAGILGFKNTENILAVESFMQQYYRQALNINHYSNLILSRCLHKADKKTSFWPKKKIHIDKNYTIAEGILTLSELNLDVFVREPAVAVRAFEYSQAFGVDIDQDAKDMILSYLERAGDEFRTSKAVAESFIKILKGKNVFKTLSEMRELKFLETYMPEFAEICGKVQHDVYHVYTVDAHTLFAVREVERLRDVHKTEFSLLATIFEELPNPEILILALLFHDMGKAYGKGHAEKGAQMVPGICERLNLAQDDVELLKFLVKDHLLLADTAQYRDLHDEKLVIEFAKKIGEIERLNLLYLLTFADVRAVGPDVWSQWKGALFQELYFKALTILERGTFEAEDAGVKMERIKKRVVEILKPEDSGVVGEFFQMLPHRYFLSTAPDFIADHIKTVRSLEGKPYVMTVRQDTLREYTEFVICTHDTHGLFSMITGVFAANAVNILGAQINTLKNGIVLDVLQVNSAIGELITEKTKLDKIEKDLSDVLTGMINVNALVSKKKPSILDMKAKPKVRTIIQIDNEVSDSYTVLDIHAQNRIGLLYDITRTLSELGAYIDIAKISTKGDEAADIFYVKDIFGQKIFYKEKLKEIIETLYKVIEKDIAAATGGL